MNTQPHGRKLVLRLALIHHNRKKEPTMGL